MLSRFINSHWFKPLACLLAAFLLYLECFVNLNKDFDVFIKASQLVFNKQNCYEVWIQVGSSGLKYFYSPLFTVLLFPLTHLPQQGYYFVWLSLNLVLLYRVFKLLPFYLPLKKLNANKQQLFYGLLILAVARSFYDVFGQGQMTIILVWGTLESLRLIKTGKIVAGSAILALIINIKLIPVSVLAYLFYKGYFKAATLTVVFFGIYLFLPGFFIGFDFNAELLHNWMMSITATNSNSLAEDNGRQSLSSAVPAFLMDTPLQFNLKRNFVNLEPYKVNLVLNAFRCGLVLLSMWLVGKPFAKQKINRKLFYDLALICLITPLFFPHQGKYSFFYLLPAYAYSLYRLIRLQQVETRQKFKAYYSSAVIFVIVSFALLTLSTDGVVGRRLSDLCEYFQCITFGTLSLLGAMLVLKTKSR